MTLSALHCDGRTVKNAANEVVILRGVNGGGLTDGGAGNWLTATGDINWNVWHADDVEDNLEAMAGYGFNCFRVPFTIEFWIDDTDSFQQNIKDLLTMADAEGIYVVLAPWRVSNSYTQPHLPYPPENGGVDDTAVIADEAAFAAFWADMANDLKGYSNVVFELWNEPYSATAGAQANWFATCQDCVDAIRATGAKNVVVVQWSYGCVPDLREHPADVPGRYALDWVETAALTDVEGNILYSTHVYWDRYNCNVHDLGSLQNGFADSCFFKHIIEDEEYPVWIGECGANMWWTGQELTDELEWYTNVLTILNNYGVGYCGWTWWGPGQAYILLEDYAAGFPLSDAGDILRTAIGVTPVPPDPPVEPEPETPVYNGQARPDTLWDAINTAFKNADPSRLMENW